MVYPSIRGNFYNEMRYINLRFTYFYLLTNPATSGRESNSQAVDYKSDTLTTALPNHQVCQVAVDGDGLLH